jgi:hypothetical protein
MTGAFCLNAGLRGTMTVDFAGEPFARQAPEFHGSQLFNDRVEAPPVLLILVVCALRTQPLALTLLPNVLGFLFF